MQHYRTLHSNWYKSVCRRKWKREKKNKLFRLNSTLLFFLFFHSDIELVLFTLIFVWLTGEWNPFIKYYPKIIKKKITINKTKTNRYDFNTWKKAFCIERDIKWQKKKKAFLSFFYYQSYAIETFNCLINYWKWVSKKDFFFCLFCLERRPRILMIAQKISLKPHIDQFIWYSLRIQRFIFHMWKHLSPPNKTKKK